MSAQERIDTTPILRGVQSQEIIDLWDLIMPIMVAACVRSRGKFTAGDIMKAIALQDMQLWLATDGPEICALAVTELVNYPQRRVCRVLIVTGEDRERWIGYSETISAWAKASGCRGIEALARPGWRRTMEALGWQMTHIFLEKDL